MRDYSVLPSHPFRPLIEEVAAEYTELDANALEAMCWIESEWVPTARSNSNARGLSQIIPDEHLRLVAETARRFGLPENDDALYDPRVALYAGGRHLRWVYVDDDPAKRTWSRAVSRYHSNMYEAGDFRDQQGTATDDHIRYFEQALATVRAARTEDDDPATLEEEMNMQMQAHQWPGARRSVYLPTWMPTPQVRIVDHRNVRSYQKFRDQTRVTRHDTGNPRTNAHGEYSWLAQGRPGGGAGGYNAIFDDRTLLITVPFDEITWHAGSPQGNRSWGTELAFGGNVNWNQAFENGAALDGGLIEMQGLNPDNAIVLHQAWTQKFCSAQILNRNLWPTYRRKVAAYANAAAVARRGGTVAEVPSETYATPSLPLVDGKPWDGNANVESNGVLFVAQKGTVKTISAVNRRQWATTESQPTGAAIEADREVNILGWVKGELVNGVSEWAIGDSGSRIWTGALDFTPKQEPDWSKYPSESDYGMVVKNGHPYLRLLDHETGEQGRTLPIHRDGVINRWADADSPEMGTVSAEDEVTAYWWTRGTEHELTFPDGATVAEGIWYCLDKDLDAGNRIWSGLTTERPH